ncbi:uncharacterized protein LOC133882405 isoform X2 [Alnus glutinosa]|uniref:uncharacterized protein LOC133882405 isoform X2 n=1 Tax=Alnus glutinosa TaxID=3517 RepID=UPI002D77D339|nr:uncharacterized protein LOC133882405 isoform X2 [Alnus glutinosa]XP_062177550.1 uncharacterized protein LOC133882405 isoform X2 [Alnus glutinosa]
MALRSGSLSRSLISTARASSLRSSRPLPRTRLPSLAAPRVQSRRRLPFAAVPRNLGELGCTQSFLPLTLATGLTSHLAANVRAFCELSHGTFRRTCQDR